MNCSKDSPNVASKINKWVEKFAVWLVGILVSIGGFMYTQMDSRVDKIEERVSYLYQDKVSRQELREEVGQLKVQIDRFGKDQAERTELMKNEILGRIDLILRFTPVGRNINGE